MIFSGGKGYMNQSIAPYRRIGWMDHQPDIGQIGTPLNAENLNYGDAGVHQANLCNTILAQELLQQRRIVQDMELEIGTVQLRNVKKWPFNSSEIVVIFRKERTTMNYRVHIEALSNVPNIGEIRVYDKQLNGFKLAYTGSAPSVSVQYFVQGGFVL